MLERKSFMEAGMFLEFCDGRSGWNMYVWMTEASSYVVDGYDEQVEMRRNETRQDQTMRRDVI